MATRASDITGRRSLDSETEQAIAQMGHDPGMPGGALSSTEEGPVSRDVDSTPARRPLDDEEIKNIVEHEISDASGYYAGELAQQRIQAMNYYLGNPRGDELSGRSQVISMDLQDALEWVMPQAVKALVDSDSPVLFDPESEDDEQQAKMETDYVSHVFCKENDGFLVAYSFTKDALMQKNGVVKVYWDERIKRTTETHTGLTPEMLQFLLNPQDGTQVIPVEATENPDGTYELRLKRVHTRGSPTVHPVPPEEFLINRDHNSLNVDNARFTAHKKICTESELIEEGWDIELVKSLPSYTVDDTGERERRRELEDEKDWGQAPYDSANRRIQVYECYVLVDQDGDGMVELLQVHVAGQKGYRLMGWEEFDENPFVGTTTNILPHKFFGLSLYDKLKQIQDQKTAIWRQLLDNLYFQNNARHEVVQGQVNLDDLLTTRPGGVVRVRAPGMINPLVAPQIGDAGYRMLEYLDQIRTGRAGVSPETADVASAVSGDTAHGIERLMSAKEELVGLMIRVLATTGLRGIMLKIRALLSKHRDGEHVFQSRGQWLKVNPSEWRHRWNTTVQVGLGTGDQLRKQGALTNVMQQQKLALEGGYGGVLVTPENLYATVTAYVRATNLGDPSPYWTDPTSPEAQQAAEQKRQTAESEKQQGQALMMRVAQMEYSIEQQKQSVQMAKVNTDAQVKMSELMQKAQQNMDDVMVKLTDIEAKLRIADKEEEVPGSAID